MTSREIIIKLIDYKKITGEEAYTLIRDIVKGESNTTWITTSTSPYTYTYTGNICTTTDNCNAYSKNM